ncbi:protein mono-ADP-ribosyltransferase PARP10 isoform X2 [Denticeps clupeoides]|uniref:protein mono-ADP-ribosyltransferase PARP10 isoform X2 n=1 Tax=Denticeps clupeoides TaxID=299321 RepID=UPI0010A56079|nr:protein mono-ADP-ribosyltransferase PARP10 isoform X2 [Denticeps clupeoides]
MDGGSAEERTLEVLGVAEKTHDELLKLYFESKRSGGDAVACLQRRGSRATVVFESAEVAARVLSKDSHVLSGVTLTVRRKASKDPQRLLLHGLDPATSDELVEMYVENLMEVEPEEYALYRSAGNNLTIIHFHQPYSDFLKLSQNVARRTLEGAQLFLEQLERTDAILVENVSPGVTEDVLSQYFENCGTEVMEISMVAEGLAKVSFKDFESVDEIMKMPHRCRDLELRIKPYFDFLLPDTSNLLVSCPSGAADPVPMETEEMPASVSTLPSTMTALTVSGNAAISETPASPAHLNDEVTYTARAKEKVQSPAASAKPAFSHIDVPDPLKLHLFEASRLPEKLRSENPDFDLHVTVDGVKVVGPDQLGVERVKNSILEFLSSIAQAHLTFDKMFSEFLAKEEVKQKILEELKEQNLPSNYEVSGPVVVVTSLSLSMVHQACNSIKALISQFSLPVEETYECMLYCQEWPAFLCTLDFCSVFITDIGRKITVVTMKDMEEEKQTAIIQFLTTPVQKDTVILMEPGMLNYLQIFYSHLLAEMNQVTLLPLESGDGLSISGNAGACQTAEEVLHGLIDAVCTKTIRVCRPGIARFLVGEEGTSILHEMQSKFQVHISMDQVHWETTNEDIFEGAWKIMSHQNFPRAFSDTGTPTGLSATNLTGDPERVHIEEAKQLLSAIDGAKGQMSGTNSVSSMSEEEDLYTADPNMQAEDPAPTSSQIQHTASPLVAQALPATNTSNLEEDARLSLAIQYSMETNVRSFAEDEKDLQEALELSLRGSTGPELSRENSLLNQAVEASLKDCIRMANVVEISVFAGYSTDLIRVDIALGKKVTQRQCEEQVSHKNLKNLSEYYKRCLDLIMRKHAVEIRVDGTTVTVSGFKDYVAEALPDVKNLLKRISNTVSDPEVLTSVQWVRNEQGTMAATPYLPEATTYIENAWKMKQKKIDILFDGQPYKIDFENMQETSVLSGKSLTIARKLLSPGDLSAVIPGRGHLCQ